MWKFYKENVSTGKVVAEFCNSKNDVILQVYAGKECYYTVSKYQFINVFAVDYAKELTLEDACKLIEENYFMQVERIRKVID